MKDDIYVLSNQEIVRNLGHRFRDYRRRLGKTQREIAEFTGLSLFTIGTFESGQTSGITLINLLKLLRSIEALGDIEHILPPLPESPRLLYKAGKNKKPRHNG
ncbi:helix-turn-helix transcriptional regulator [uncultured Alistipes sp.]|uniref:helix-turn-helix domain-containing protein n=1 Tax=uncultured Alistipes sp. TaxID=538949 RepID=UPI00259B47B3|nr:helix-turn-helix transcriptional regulator [uncultured Alistipes sp.]